MVSGFGKLSLQENRPCVLETTRKYKTMHSEVQNVTQAVSCTTQKNERENVAEYTFGRFWKTEPWKGSGICVGHREVRGKTQARFG